MIVPDYRTEWFASALLGHREVDGVEILSDSLIGITRKKRLPPITVTPLGNYVIDESLVEMILAQEEVPTAIVLIPKAGHYDWPARELAMANESSVLTVKELYTFMSESDPRAYQDKSVAYILTRLRQHSRIVGVEMICEASMHIRRAGPLSDVIAAVEYEYEFSEEALVRAIDRHPDADIVVNANPNGSTTTAAGAYAHDVGVKLVGIRELMVALNDR